MWGWEVAAQPPRWHRPSPPETIWVKVCGCWVLLVPMEEQVQVQDGAIRKQMLSFQALLPPHPTPVPQMQGHGWKPFSPWL